VAPATPEFEVREEILAPTIRSNLPPAILPDNMVQECDSQTGRCWFTTKPEVVPIIGTSGTVFTLEHKPNEVPIKPDTQGWSSGTKTAPVKPAPAKVEPAVNGEEPTQSTTAPATGGWTSDTAASTPADKPVKKAPTIKRNIDQPATQGWSSGLPPTPTSKGKLEPSTAGVIQDVVPQR